MIRHGVLVALVLQTASINFVSPVKQHLQLSDSYLPVAMQVIAHITDQLTYTDKENLNKGTAKPTTSKPWTTTKRPSRKPTTSRPLDWTTPLHKPGLFAPEYPPRPEDRKNGKGQKEILKHKRFDEDEENLFKDDDEQSEEVSYRSNDDDDDDGEYEEENLQYLDPNVRNLIILAHDRNDERLVDVWDGERSGPPLSGNKAHGGSFSSTHLRLLLLYDLLSREAKKQKLAEFHGFSDRVMRELEESSRGSAREQLSFALSKMIDHHDCGHDYANNRAREMIAELAKDESTMSMEMRYLKTLNYSL